MPTPLSHTCSTCSDWMTCRMTSQSPNAPRLWKELVLACGLHCMRWCQLPLCVVLQVHQSQVHAVRGWRRTRGGGCGWVLRRGWCWRCRHGAGRCTVVCCTLASTYVVGVQSERMPVQSVAPLCVLCVNAWVSGFTSTQVWPHSVAPFCVRKCVLTDLSWCSSAFVCRAVSLPCPPMVWPLAPPQPLGAG